MKQANKKKHEVKIMTSNYTTNSSNLYTQIITELG